MQRFSCRASFTLQRDEETITKKTMLEVYFREMSINGESSEMRPIKVRQINDILFLSNQSKC